MTNDGPLKATIETINHEGATMLTLSGNFHVCKAVYDNDDSDKELDSLEDYQMQVELYPPLKQVTFKFNDLEVVLYKEAALALVSFLNS